MANVDHDPRDDTDAQPTLEDRTQEIAELIQSPGSSLVPMIEKAQMDTMIVTARAYRRVISKAMEAIASMARLDKQAAEECVYALPRGGKPIIGPSIRFAEVAKQCWGNCSVMAYVTSFDRSEGWIEAEGRFIDLETLAETKQRVRRRIVDKRGRTFSDDMIIVTGNAACSIVMRNVILAGIPRPVWRLGYEAALSIAIDHKGETFVETRDRALKSFSQFGVTTEQVLGALGLRAVEDLVGEHVPVLRGMFSALKNGEETVETLFDPRQGRPFVAVKNPLQDEQPGPVDEGGRTDRAQEGAGNGQGGGQGASGAKPAAEQRTQSAAQQAAAQANADPKPTKTGEAVPSNDPEYRIFATAWIAAGKSVSGVNERWKRERGLRDDCKVEARTTDDLIEARDAKITELKDAAK